MVSMTDNLSEIYLEKLKTEQNSCLILAKFFCELFTLPLARDKIIIFSKLVKAYSKEDIFFSILDCYDMDNVNTNKIYPLLVYFCKKRLEEKTKTLREDINLSSTSDEILKKIKKTSKQKLIILDPFEE